MLKPLVLLVEDGPLLVFSLRCFYTNEALMCYWRLMDNWQPQRSMPTYSDFVHWLPILDMDVARTGGNWRGEPENLRR